MSLFICRSTLNGSMEDLDDISEFEELEVEEAIENKEENVSQ